MKLSIYLGSSTQIAHLLLKVGFAKLKRNFENVGMLEKFLTKYLLKSMKTLN